MVRRDPRQRALLVLTASWFAVAPGSSGCSSTNRTRPAASSGGTDAAGQSDPRGARGRHPAQEARSESTRIAPDLVARRLEGASAWIVTHEDPIPANSLVYVTTDGSPILADTPWTPTATQDLLDWVQRQLGRQPVLATVSHYHLDASGGIEALLAAGVPVVASTGTARILATRGPSLQATLAQQHGSDFVGWSVPAPNRTFLPQEGYSARVGGTELRVIFPGPAHSSDNVVTWFPETGVLFGGCLVKGGDSLGYLGDASLETYPAAIRRLHGLRARIVVPGHGDRTDVGQLDNTLRLIEREGSNQDRGRTGAP